MNAVVLHNAHTKALVSPLSNDTSEGRVLDDDGGRGARSTVDA